MPTDAEYVELVRQDGLTGEIAITQSGQLHTGHGGRRIFKDGISWPLELTKPCSPAIYNSLPLGRMAAAS